VNEKEEEKSNSKWSFKKIFSKGNNDEERIDKINGNILFNTLTQFIHHFTNFGMSV